MVADLSGMDCFNKIERKLKKNTISVNTNRELNRMPERGEKNKNFMHTKEASKADSDAG
ncbi:MAG: hypothetical protein HFG72_11980 [Hungatella sp.]|jgi:hypothetical protein|nr:hypothetical protein [Hungatella sp.]